MLCGMVYKIKNKTTTVIISLVPPLNIYNTHSTYYLSWGN